MRFSIPTLQMNDYHNDHLITTTRMSRFLYNVTPPGSYRTLAELTSYNPL